MWYRKHSKSLGLLLAGALCLSSLIPAYSEDSMLLRSVPFEVTGYTEAATLDQTIQTADGTYALLTTSKPLLVHMEALRRAYKVYGSNTAEKDKLLTALKDRYMKDANNAEKFFDYGYAQLVMDGNKNGLFFLRKANDKLASPYTALAYGLAQVDIDILVEKATTTDLTTRKMDAMYKLKDALMFNKEDHLPGIWPSYIHIVEALKSYPAYDSLVKEDVSAMYVPYGFVSISRAPGGFQFMSLDSTANPETKPSSTIKTSISEVAGTCQFSSEPVNWAAMAMSKAVDMDNDGKQETVGFFSAGENRPYQVKVLSPENRVIGEFTSFKAPYIIEDIDSDSKFELVVRQFDKDPYHPLYVYRWNGSCFGEDKRITTLFQ